MNRMQFCPIVLVVVYEILIALAGCQPALAAEIEKDYRECVETTFPYELFKSAFRDVTEPPDLTSRENYDIFLEILVKDYKESFTLDEMREIASFYESPLGKKLLRHSLQSKAYDEFHDKVGTLRLWTCVDHEEIKVPPESKVRKCPICGKQLVPLKSITYKAPDADD